MRITLHYITLHQLFNLYDCARGTLTIDNSVFQNLAHLRIVKAETVAIQSSNFFGQSFNVRQYYNNIIRRLEVLNCSFHDSNLHVHSTDNALIQNSLFSNGSEGITAYSAQQISILNRFFHIDARAIFVYSCENVLIQGSLFLRGTLPVRGSKFSM